MAQRVPARLSTAQARRFGLTVGPAFVGLAVILVWRGHAMGASVAAAGGGVLTLVALAAPSALRPVERIWMRFAHGISTVTTPLVMGVVYFLVLAPIGVALRAMGRSPLRHAGAAGGLWVSRDQEAGRRGGMNRQF